METHPTLIIDTDDGNIVMSKPNVKRSTALTNSIYSYLLTDEELLKCNRMQSDNERDEFIKIKSLKKGYTMYQLSILSYVESAPWHLNDYAIEPLLDLKSFMDYIDDKPDLLKKMGETMKEIGQIDPLSV